MNSIIVDDDPLMLKLVEGLIAKAGTIEHLKSFSNPREAQEFIRNEKVDLIFLDVEMPEMSGIDLIQSLQYKPQVILITSKESYAVDAFKLEVTDYLVKPPTFERFMKACKRAEENLAERGKFEVSKDKLFIKVDSHLVGINIDEITMVEAMADYVGIFAGEKKYVVYSTMKGIESKLPPSVFVRVHRSYIVNINRINSIEDGTLTIGQKLIPVGVTYKEKLMNTLNLL